MHGGISQSCVTFHYKRRRQLHGSRWHGSWLAQLAAESRGGLGAGCVSPRVASAHAAPRSRQLCCAPVASLRCHCFASSGRMFGADTGEAAAQQLAAAWAEGTAAEREEAYVSLESTVRAAVAGGGDSERAAAAALAALCVEPLCALSAADAAKVGAAELQRVNLLVGELAALDALPGAGRGGGYVSAQLWHEGEGAAFNRCFENPRGVFAELVDKDPGSWTRDDALTIAACMSRFPPCCVVGLTAVLAADGTMSELGFIQDWLAHTPFIGANSDPPDRFQPLALLILDLLREPRENHPHQGLVRGAWHALCWMPMLLGGAPPSIAQALFEAGFVQVFLEHLRPFSPAEQIAKKHMEVTSMFSALKDVVQGAQKAGIDVMQPLLDAGAIDIALSTLTAYQRDVGDPQEVSVVAVVWGTLFLLETLAFRGSAADAAIIVAKLRAESQGAFMYLLDHPLAFLKDFGFDTGTIGTRIAATVWGREEEAAAGDDAFRFKQRDIDSILLVAAKEGMVASTFPMDRVCCGAILSLCVSDANKAMLLASENDVITVLLDNLLLDPEHPRRTDPQTDFEGIKELVQLDSVEAIHQLAASASGRDALIERGVPVTDALHEVARIGWGPKARQFASSALLALSPSRSSVAAPASQDEAAVARSLGTGHVMLSYSWAHQASMKRVVQSLQHRGFATWFDLHDMTGNIVDAMSEAIDGAVRHAVSTP
jgi:hypothetical protein